MSNVGQIARRNLMVTLLADIVIILMITLVGLIMRTFMIKLCSSFLSRFLGVVAPVCCGLIVWHRLMLAVERRSTAHHFCATSYSIHKLLFGGILLEAGIASVYIAAVWFPAQFC